MSGKKYEGMSGGIIHWYGRDRVVCNINLEKEGGIEYLDNVYITRIVAGSKYWPGKKVWISMVLKKIDSINTENVYKYIFFLSLWKVSEWYLTDPLEINYAEYNGYNVLSFQIKVPIELSNEEAKSLYEAITEIAQKCVGQNLQGLSQLILRHILSKVGISGLMDKK